MGGKHRRGGCAVVEQKQDSVERDVSANASKRQKTKNKIQLYSEDRESLKCFKWMTCLYLH